MPFDTCVALIKCNTLIDGRQTHHHEYVTHWPITYAIVLMVSIILLRPSPDTGKWGLCFSLSAWLHLVLDSVAAPNMWLAPFSEATIELFTVPTTHSNWIVSFVSHWTFGIELAICFVAGLLFLKRRAT